MLCIHVLCVIGYLVTEGIVKVVANQLDSLGKPMVFTVWAGEDSSIHIVLAVQD